MKKFFAIVCTFACINSFAQAPVNLDPITVTATRTAQKISETGRSITVIPGKTFQQLPVNSIDELLKYVPGVEVQSRGPMGAQSDIVMRGGTFQQVLVLLDGIKLNDPLTGHFSSYIPIAPFEIDRIEVLRGPAAAIYGAEAVGGVINIITKTFSQFKKEKATHTNIEMAFGQYRYIKGDGGVYRTAPKANFAIGVLSNNTTGQNLIIPNRGFLNNHTLSSSVALALKNNWQLALRSSFDSRNFAAQNFYTTFKSDTAVEKVEIWWNQAQLKKQSDKKSQQFDIMYKQTHDNYLYNPSSIANDNRSKHLLVQYLQSLTLNKNYSLSMGTQFDRRAIASNDRGNHATHHGAAFGTLFYSKNNFRLSPGIRVDWDENYGVAVLPQINSSYQIKNITLRANAGRAIRSADFTERFNNYNKVIVRSGTMGNPNLKTENSWSYEAGADALISNNFKASVSGFIRDQNNVIDFVTTAYADMPRKDNLVIGGTYALAKNIKKVTTTGVEMELTYQKAFNNKQHLFINTGVTFLRSNSSDSVPSFYIISHARTLIQSSIIYNIHKLSIATNLIYKNRGERNATAINALLTKDYFLINAKISYAVCDKMKLFVAVNNITDVKYSDLLGSIMPRRWNSAGFNISF